MTPGPHVVKVDNDRGALWCLTFELRRDRRQDARPGPVKMYSVPPARAWWLAVGPRLERGVRRHWWLLGKADSQSLVSCVTRPLVTGQLNS